MNRILIFYKFAFGICLCRSELPASSGVQLCCQTYSSNHRPATTPNLLLISTSEPSSSKSQQPTDFYPFLPAQQHQSVWQQSKQQQKFTGINYKTWLTGTSINKGIKFLNSKENDGDMDDMAYFIVAALYCLVCSLSSCYFITYNAEECQKGLCSLTKSRRGATDHHVMAPAYK